MNSLEAMADLPFHTHNALQMTCSLADIRSSEGIKAPQPNRYEETPLTSSYHIMQPNSDVENENETSKSAENDNVTSMFAENYDANSMSAGDDVTISAKRKHGAETYSFQKKKNFHASAEIDHVTSKSAGDDVPMSAKSKHVAEPYSTRKKNIDAAMYRKTSVKSDMQFSYSEDPNDIVEKRLWSETEYDCHAGLFMGSETDEYLQVCQHELPTAEGMTRDKESTRTCGRWQAEVPWGRGHEEVWTGGGIVRTLESLTPTWPPEKCYASILQECLNFRLIHPHWANLSQQMANPLSGTGCQVGRFGREENSAGKICHHCCLLECWRGFHPFDDDITPQKLDPRLMKGAPPGAIVKCHPSGWVQSEEADAPGIQTDEIGLRDVSHQPGPSAVMDPSTPGPSALQTFITQQDIYHIPVLPKKTSNRGRNSAEKLDGSIEDFVGVMAIEVNGAAGTTTEDTKLNRGPAGRKEASRYIYNEDVARSPHPHNLLGHRDVEPQIKDSEIWRSLCAFVEQLQLDRYSGEWKTQIDPENWLSKCIKGRVILKKEGLGKDWDGNSHGLWLGPILAVAWYDFGKPRKAEIMMAGPGIEPGPS
ncbi:hypothetical protein PR048_012563 [Dryococelus australis]|uniref:Uncharacterized protein n=1 Tax=Dryococelus australis TaxID=614101 RepID=A0ABQ9HPP8_9NEOP|nr:hypothetical protein PR048_012563 [Dryococelus australis]